MKLSKHLKRGCLKEKDLISNKKIDDRTAVLNFIKNGMTDIGLKVLIICWRLILKKYTNRNDLYKPANEAKQAPSKLVKFYITQAELMDEGTLCCRCGCEIYSPFLTC